MERKIQGLLEIHLAVLLFGLSGLFGKFLCQGPVVIVFGRCVFAALTLGLLFYREVRRFRSGSSLAVFLLLGGILALHWATFFHAIQVSTVAVGLLTFSTFPLFVTFLEPWFFRERLRIFDIFTALLVLAGLLLVIPSLDFSHHLTRGAFWGTVSGLTFAILSIVNRRYVREYSPYTIAFFQNGFAALILAPFFFLEGATLSPKDLLLLVLLGVFCTAMAHGLFIKALRHIKAQLASVTTCLEPVYGIVFALILLGEIPSARTVLGGTIILATTAAASMKTRTREQSSPSPP
ncbi:MAG: EamA family transporter [Deltaproteobacteria bacterium]|nr:EamA family transporter [Deltaproteobacteria bacterium]